MNLILVLLGIISAFHSPSPEQDGLAAASRGLLPEAAAVMAYAGEPERSSYVDRFTSLAGASLYMSEEELLLAKGTPLQIAPDPWQDCLEYQYADMSAGLCGGAVLYIHITPVQAGQYGIKLNGEELNPVNSHIAVLLGSPDFVAEDGDVYIRGNAALKIYRNMLTGAWEGIDLFDTHSS